MSNIYKRTMLFLSLCVLVVFAPAHSYDLKPIIIQLAPSGAGASQSMVITNTHDVPIAIEVRAYTRVQHPDGSETRTPEDEDLIISPPQMVIAPKSSQSFKVRWVGDPAPEKELSYRLVTTQLPIKFKDETTGDVNMKVTMNYKYEAALYIVPQRSEPLAELTDVSAVKDEVGTTWLQAKVLSKGTRRAILKSPVLTITPKAGGNSVTLEGEAVAPLQNVNILVGNERVVRMPWPENLPVGPLKGELSTEYTVFN